MLIVFLLLLERMKIRPPLQGLVGRGWLGHSMYARHGVVVSPYPIGIWPYNRYLSMYYSVKGWCYQQRRTWHGMQPVAERAYWPKNPRYITQQAYRRRFRNGMTSWYGLGLAGQDIYNKMRGMKQKLGRTRFMHMYLKSTPPRIGEWSDPLVSWGDASYSWTG